MAVIPKTSVAQAKPGELPQVQGHPRLRGETLPKKTTENRNTDLPLPPILDSTGLVHCAPPSPSELTLSVVTFYPLPYLSDPCLLPACSRSLNRTEGRTDSELHKTGGLLVFRNY